MPNTNTNTNTINNLTYFVQKIPFIIKIDVPRMEIL